MSDSPSQTPAQTLAHWLSVAYAHKSMGKGANPLLSFQDALHDDRALRAAAAEKLQALSRIPDERCVISRVHRAFLSEALAPQTWS